MIRRALLAIAACALAPFAANAARYVTFSFYAGTDFSITIDTVATPPGSGMGSGAYDVSYDTAHLDLFGVPCCDFVDHYASIYFGGTLDFSPSSFQFTPVGWHGGWGADWFIWLGPMNQEVHSFGGRVTGLVISGTDIPRPVGIGAGILSHPDAVPEPGVWAMTLIGFGFIGFAMRRKVGRSFA